MSEDLCKWVSIMSERKMKRQSPRIINRWRPDWRKPKEYLRFENITDEQWAWEFLRRKPRFQEAWEYYNKGKSKPSPSELRREFGVNDLCDPATEWEDDGVWIPDSETSWHALAFEQFPDIAYTTWQDKKACLEGRGMTTDEFARATQPQYIEEVVIKINLLNDIQSQLVAASRLLELNRKLGRVLYQATKSGKANQFSVKRSRGEYTVYLRLLDAQVKVKTEGTSVAAFLREVQPELAPADEDSLESSIRKLRNNFNQACRMRDYGYRSLTHVTDLKAFILPPVRKDEEGRQIGPPKNQQKNKSLQDRKSKRFAPKQPEE